MTTQGGRPTEDNLELRCRAHDAYEEVQRFAELRTRPTTELSGTSPRDARRGSQCRSRVSNPKDAVTYVDAAVLNVTEVLCRALQRLTGRTNVWLAIQLTNLSIIGYFAWAGMYFVISDTATRIILAAFCAGILSLLTQTVFKVPIEAYENSAYRRVANGLRNPRRIRDAMLRIVFLTLALVLLYPVILVHLYVRAPLITVGYSLVVLTTIVLYVLACDPLPPCRGRLARWLRPSPALQPASTLGAEPSRQRRRSLRLGPGPS